MGKLECLRCGATTECSSEKDGRKKLDHSVGLSVGRPCGDNRGSFKFDGPSKKETTQSNESKSK